MNKNLFEEISNYIVKTVQEESTLEGFQYTINQSDIQERFGKEIDEYIINKIIEVTSKKEEVAEIFTDTDGFDVTLIDLN
ncbi:uncharacterized protein CBO05P1_231 [Clostridium botulinum B str. Osaka05]|uniref:Uncharacterized protein n=1 Tax=Clostridium botulinum B str. Osaka05 TaxID=1407017 RepID=A0A060N5X2_CLOBO|nr:hypothetical protein [Clostridium botulinum]BAO04950.1 uncharacterized protein CBO05P1_231 [Clostridium botulinum B str. Osaka05]